MNRFHLAGESYFPADEIELTEEQAKRFNLDLFAEIAAESVREAEPTATAVQLPMYQRSQWSVAKDIHKKPRLR